MERTILIERFFKLCGTVRLPRLFVFLGVGLFVSCLMLTSAMAVWAQSAQTDAGAMMRYQQQEMWYRQNTPWLFRPVRDEDTEPPEEPVIEFHNMDVEAQIVRPDQPSEMDSYIENSPQQ